MQSDILFHGCERLERVFELRVCTLVLFIAFSVDIKDDVNKIFGFVVDDDIVNNSNSFIYWFSSYYICEI